MYKKNNSKDNSQLKNNEIEFSTKCKIILGVTKYMPIKVRKFYLSNLLNELRFIIVRSIFKKGYDFYVQII